ncbi:MAG: LysM peptidoglycan-binding domain-containing protein [Anaerolineae bacterium]|nr:LysM peptidoglycan-binding domain-containing protein [Anaerolineae bacterium]
MLKKKTVKWIMVLGLFLVGLLLLPVSAYGQWGQKEEDKQVLRIIIDQVETNFGDFEREAEFRLVGQPIFDDVSIQDTHSNNKVTPPCGPAQKVPKQTRATLKEPLFFDFDMTTIESQQSIKIYYFAVEENTIQNLDNILDIPKDCTPPEEGRSVASVPVLVRILITELIKVGYNELKDKTYGYGNFVVNKENNNWNADGKRHFVDSAGITSWQEGLDKVAENGLPNLVSGIINTLREQPGVLKIGYCVRVIDTSSPNPKSCLENAGPSEDLSGNDDQHGDPPLVHPPTNPNPQSDDASEDPPVFREATCDGYKVQPGDTFFSIAHRNGIVPHLLAAINSIPYPPAVDAGQCLRLPDQSPIPSAPPVNGSNCNGYTVQPRENFFDVAARLRVNPHHLRIFNGIPYPPIVYAGQCVRLPY